MTENIEFNVSSVIKNFVFDLHQASRIALLPDEVQKLYEVDFREITDKYFSSSPWPEPKVIASECNNDEVFMSFYREITLRHLFTKLKPQLKDFYESWNNYTQIFQFLLGSKAEVALHTQWIYDLMVEFIYQFQGFCQYRCQLATRSQADIESLSSNPTAWTYPAVARILNGLIKLSGIADKKTRPTIKPNSSVKLQFGFFAAIELARLECICGDHISSLRASSIIDIFEHAEILDLVPVCHINLFYHMGTSQLLLRRFTDCIDTFSHVLLQIAPVLKPGGSTLRNALVLTLNKISDKILALCAIAMTLSPGRRVDDQVRELINSKYKDKVQKMIEGEIKTYTEMFEIASPKFIVLGAPDYSNPVNLNQENFNRQVQTFIKEVEQNLSVLKLRSYLRLYAAIEVSKLARFNDMTENEFTSILIAFKHKAVQVETSAVSGSKPVYTSDVNYLIQDGNVVIDASGSRLDKEKIFEKYFITGIRKHAEMIQILSNK